MTSIDVDALTAECQAMLPMLSAYIDHELAVDKVTQVETHLADCAFCRLALDEMTEASRSYRALVPLLPPAALREGVWEGLGQALSPEEAFGQEAARSGASSADGAAAPSMAHVSRPKRHWMARAVALTAGVLAMVLLGAVGAIWVDSLVPVEPVAIDVPDLALPEPGDDEGAAVGGEGVDTEAGTTPREATPEVVETDDIAPETPVQVSPKDGERFAAGAAVVFQWRPVEDPSGVTYAIEIERFNPTTRTYEPLREESGLEDTMLVHTAGAGYERWRILAVDGAGNASAPSAWRTYGSVIYLRLPLGPSQPLTIS